MFSNSEEVLKFISDEKVEYLDIRFCDLPGVMQHLTVPAAAVDEDFLESEGIYYAFHCVPCNVTATSYQQT